MGAKLLPPIPKTFDFSTSSLPTPFLQALSSLSKQSSLQRKVLIDPAIREKSKHIQVQELSIEDCLHNYFRREVIDFTAEYTCEKCNRVVEVMRDSNMEHAPFILILHLMRFAFDNTRSIKLSEDVRYPIHVIYLRPCQLGLGLFRVL